MRTKPDSVQNKSRHYKCNTNQSGQVTLPLISKTCLETRCSCSSTDSSLLPPSLNFLSFSVAPSLLRPEAESLCFPSPLPLLLFNSSPSPYTPTLPSRLLLFESPAAFDFFVPSSPPFHLSPPPPSLRRFDDDAYSSEYSPFPCASFESSLRFSPEPESFDAFALPLSSLLLRSFAPESRSESECSLASRELCLLDLCFELRGIAEANHTTTKP